MSYRRVTVIGNITRDTIYRLGQTAITALGGALYNIVTLAVLLPHMQIIPIANVGQDIYNEVIFLLRCFSNVNLSGLRSIPQRNVHSFLFLVSEYGVQFDIGQAIPVTYSQVSPFLETQFILVTFPTGFDLSLNTLRRLAMEATAPLYLDYHILTRARDESGVRYLRRRRNWREWLKVADFVQFNQFEAEHLARHSMQTVADIRSFGQSLLTQKTRGVLVTCGADGSFLIHADVQSYRCLHIPAEPVNMMVSTTGCGCVHAAGFVAGYLLLGKVEAAAQFAARAAAQCCAASDMHSLAAALRHLTA